MITHGWGYFKLLRRDMTHMGFTYKAGINFIPASTFRPDPEDPVGGLFLCRFADIPRWLNLYEDLEFIAYARIGFTSKASEGRGKVKVDMFFMSYPMFLYRFLQDHFKKFYLLGLHPSNLRFYRKQPITMIEWAIDQDPHAIQYVVKPHMATMKRAVSMNGLTLRHLTDPQPEIVLAAVEQNGLALAYWQRQRYDTRYSRNLTDKICLTAVQQNGLALAFVQNKTPEIEKAAVAQNGWALLYVDKQTAELAHAAFSRDPSTYKIIRPEFRATMDRATTFRGTRRIAWDRPTVVIH